MPAPLRVDGEGCGRDARAWGAVRSAEGMTVKGMRIERAQVDGTGSSTCVVPWRKGGWTGGEVPPSVRGAPPWAWVGGGGGTPGQVTSVGEAGRFPGRSHPGGSPPGGPSGASPDPDPVPGPVRSPVRDTAWAAVRDNCPHFLLSQ